MSLDSQKKIYATQRNINHIIEYIRPDTDGKKEIILHKALLWFFSIICIENWVYVYFPTGYV